MKKTSLISLALGSLLLADLSAASTQEQIDATKAKIALLQANLTKLEATLPTDVEKEKAIAAAKRAEHNAFKTHAEFGYISTSGNTDITTYNLDLKMKKNWDKHVVALFADAQYADDSGIETKNKYLIELTYDYEITDRFAFGYLAGYKEDKFSGYNYQAYTGPGVKYKAIQEEKQQLVLEGHLLYSQDEVEAPPVTDNYTSFRAKAAYEWQIFNNLKFTQDLTYRTDVEDTENYFVFSKTAFTSKLSDMFSFGISYKVDYVNANPLNTVHSDKTLTANLIADF